MKTSSASMVQAFYDQSADDYATLMDEEVKTPLYENTLSALARRLEGVAGPVLDTSCGPGHMLSLYREQHDAARSVIGIDLSPRMVAIARGRLGDAARVEVGDMTDLSRFEADSMAAVLSFFAIHHIEPGQTLAAFGEWHRVLASGGQLVLAAWSGSGAIDYGQASDVVALKYSPEEVSDWLVQSQFRIDRCDVEYFEDMDMHSAFVDATAL